MIKSPRDLINSPPPAPAGATTIRITTGDALAMLREVPDASFGCAVTSPPYFFARDYGHADQIGLEVSSDLYIGKLVAVFAELRRTLTETGTFWLVIGDNYCGRRAIRPDAMRTAHRTSEGLPSWRDSAAAGLTLAPYLSRHLGLDDGDLHLVPHRLAIALQQDGWYVRSCIHWIKPQVTPGRITTAPANCVEYVFLLTKSLRYTFAAEVLEEAGVTGSGRPARNVWEIPAMNNAAEHLAMMPLALAERCVLAGSQPGDWIVDPFAGAGTVGVAARRHGRHAHLIDLNPAYTALAQDRLGV